MVSLKHKFTSPKADGSDATLVKPSNWNDEHDLVVAAPSILGALAAGPVVELPLDVAVPGPDDGTMYTKAAVDAAIAAAVAGISIGETGDLWGSLRASKVGWLLLDGRTIGNVGSAAVFANASAQQLFTLMWNINGATWPVLDATTNLPSRGASAAADWASVAPFKKIALPDARGCVIGMLDLGAGINALLVNLGIKVGSDKVSLTIPNLPSHTHPGGFVGGNTTPSTGGGNVHGGDPAPTGATGGDPAAVPPFSVPVPVNVVNPTMGANIFIKL